MPEGLEAIIFTADGDMRQALNNLQATYSGFRFVNQENVFKVQFGELVSCNLYFLESSEQYTAYVTLQVCDQPHPLHVKNMIRHVLEGKFDDACSGLKQLYDLGYSATDIITTLFRIIKNYDMPEYLKLEFMKVTKFSPCTKFLPLYASKITTLLIPDFYETAGNWLCPHEDLRWGRFIPSTLWPSGQVFASSRHSQSSISRPDLYVGSLVERVNLFRDNFVVEGY